MKIAWINYCAAIAISKESALSGDNQKHRPDFNRGGVLFALAKTFHPSSSPFISSDSFAPFSSSSSIIGTRHMGHSPGSSETNPQFGHLYMNV
jgi:hypothetical protein